MFRSEHILKNYLELPNPPTRFIKCLKRLYKQTYANHKFDIIMSHLHVSVDLQNDEKNVLQELVPVKIGNVSWNLIKNAGPPGPTHIDRGRKTALQIPIIADPKIHFAYVLKDEKYFDKLEPQKNSTGFVQKLETKWLNQRYPGMPMFHVFVEKYFDISPVNPWVPYLNDTSVPHGGIHKAPEHRYFFSISLTERKEINDLKKDFQNWL